MLYKKTFLVKQKISVRRSILDPWVLIPTLTITALGILFLTRIATIYVGIIFIILSLYWLYSRLNVKYIIDECGITIYYGNKVIKKLGWSMIKNMRIIIRGGNLDKNDRFIRILGISQYSNYGLHYILDIGTIEFRDDNNMLICRLKGVKVYKVISEIYRHISLNR